MGIPVLLSGCIVVPIPKEHQFAQGRRTINDQELSQLVSGETTRESVLLKFGEPDIVSADGEKIAYKWHMNKAFWLAILGGDYSGQIFGGDIPEKHLIILSFDEKGVLQDFTADEFYIAGIDLKLREQGFTKEGQLIVLRSHLPPVSNKSVEKEIGPRIQLLDIVDSRPNFENAQHLIGDFKAIGVFISNISLDVPAAEAIHSLAENEIQMLGATITTTEPDWILTGEIIELKISTPGFLKLKAETSLHIRIRLDPIRSLSDPIDKDYTATSSVTIDDFHETESMQESLTNCLKQFQEELALDLESLVQIH